jgi:hypothetical protein
MAYKLKGDGKIPDQILIWRGFHPLHGLSALPLSIRCRAASQFGEGIEGKINYLQNPYGKCKI